MIKFNVSYNLNNGQESIVFKEGKGNTISGDYNNGTLTGTLEGNNLKGSFHNKKLNKAGLIEFTFHESGFDGKWKIGLEPGPMKGKWQGQLNQLGAEVIRKINQDYVIDWNLNNDQVLVLAGDWAFEVALKYGIYECQNKRTFRPSKYMAFYKNSQIDTLFEIIEQPYDNGTGKNTPEMAQMKIDMPNYDDKTPRRIIKLKKLLDVGPIKNDGKSKSGKTVPFTYGQARYTKFELISQAKFTSKLVNGIIEESIVLQEKGAFTYVDPNEATIKLMWSTNEDFDIAILYKSKDSSIGLIYFGNKGTYDKFPFMSLDKDEMSGIRQKTETILLNHLNEIDEIAIVAWDYSNLGKKANFDISDVRVSIQDRNGFESISKLTVSEKSDSVCVASIKKTKDGFVFTNVSKSFMRVHSSKRLWNLIFG